MYSMVGSRINVLTLSLKDGFVNRNVFVKLGKLNLDIWGSILFRLFMKVHLSLRKNGNWRRKCLQDLTLKYRAG